MKDTSGGLPTAATFTSLYQAGQTVQRHGIMHRLKDGTEGTIVLVGTWEVLKYSSCYHVYILLLNFITENPDRFI